MAGIKTPGIDVDVSWPLTVAVLGIVGVVLYFVWKTITSTGATDAVKGAAGTVGAVTGLGTSLVNDVSGAVQTLTGTDKPPASGGPSNSQLFYGCLGDPSQCVQNLF